MIASPTETRLILSGMPQRHSIPGTETHSVVLSVYGGHLPALQFGKWTHVSFWSPRRKEVGGLCGEGPTEVMQLYC